MQITIRGAMTITQLRQAFFEKLSEIEDEFAIQHFKGATIYFTPINEHGEEVVPVNKSGRTISKIFSNGPYKSAADDFQI